MQKVPVKEARFSSDVDFGASRGLVRLVNEKIYPNVSMYINEYRFLVIQDDTKEDTWVPLEHVVKLIPCQTPQTSSSKSKEPATKAPKSKQKGTNPPGKLF